MGLTLEQGKDALARLYLATLQALACGTRHIVESMNAAGHEIERIVMCGGGTKNPYWFARERRCDGVRDSSRQRGGCGDPRCGGALTVACGDFASMPETTRPRWSCPGGSIKACPETKAFHDAKYAVYLPQLYEDMERCRSAMRQRR